MFPLSKTWCLACPFGERNNWSHRQKSSLIIPTWKKQQGTHTQNHPSTFEANKGQADSHWNLHIVIRCFCFSVCLFLKEYIHFISTANLVLLTCVVAALHRKLWPQVLIRAFHSHHSHFTSCQESRKLMSHIEVLTSRQDGKLALQTCHRYVSLTKQGRGERKMNEK